MKKQDIFNHDIRWLANKKKMDEELDNLDDLIKQYRDPNADSFNRDIAASNMSFHAGQIWSIHKNFESIENEILEQFSYVNQDIVIEDRETSASIW